MTTPTATIEPNAQISVQQRAHAGRIPWAGPLVMVVARLSFAFLAQGLVAAWFLLGGAAEPWRASAPWFMVSATLIDLGSLALLAWLTHQEGIRLHDLVGVERARLLRDVLTGLLYLLALVPMLLVSSLVQRFFYGDALPPQLVGGIAPWGAVYSVVVWPVIWAIAEELTYLGYALPRLEALTGRTSIAAVVVIVFWAVQHIALPFVPDGRYLLYRTLSALPITFAMTALYLLRGRRLTPLIVAHWLGDMGTALAVHMLLPSAAVQICQQTAA